MKITIEQLYQLYATRQKAIEIDFKSLVPEIVKPERYTHLIHPYPAKLLVFGTGVWGFEEANYK